MDLFTLQQQIREHKLLPFYVFTGEEIELQNIYLKQMGNIVRVDNVAQIYNKITSKLISSKFTIYVVRDDMDFIKSEKAWANISKKIKNAVLILQVTSPDKRSKFYKEMEDCTVQFDHMTTDQLVSVLTGQISGSQAMLRYFIEACNNDYNTLLNYIDMFHRMGYLSVTKELVDEYVPRQEDINIFELADAIMQKDNKKCIYLLDKILEDSSNAMGVIYAIYNQLHKCVLVEGYRGEKDIAKLTGVNGWVCNNILKYNRIKPNKLLKALRLVQKYDKGVKTGKYEAVNACYSLVIEILSCC